MKPSCFWYIITLLLLSTTPSINMSEQDVSEDSGWTEVARVVRIVLKNCWPNGEYKFEGQLRAFESCLGAKILTVLDRMIRRDVIKISSGMELIKRGSDNNHTESRQEKELVPHVGSQQGKVAWRSQVLDKITGVFQTHVLKIHLEEFGVDETTSTPDANQARRRHHRKNQMMPLMMFGMVGLGMILIPMGFKFLAVLGGKALLLAKMALLLSSIQGLKKIAMSNLNYGLYQQQSHGWGYDRLINENGEKGYPPIPGRHNYDLADQQLNYLQNINPRV